MSYEAFGKHRSGDWHSAGTLGTSLILPRFTNRGYTGHEHVDEMGLIHMNGRVYDPELGRFLSADPNIQAPHNSQSYNRYAYVMNNPLKYTDPSGYFWKKLKQVVRDVGQHFRYITGQDAIYRYVKRNAWAQTLIQIGAAMVGGPALAGLVSVGLARMNGVGWNDALKGGALTALSGYVAVGIGSLDIGSLGLSFLAHGVAQGGVAELGGGEFRSGFWSGAIGHAFSGPMQSDGNGLMSLSNRSAQGVMLRTAVAAVAGGTVSVLGGGKFANGAKTAAFVHLFNAEGGVRKIIDSTKEAWDHYINGNGEPVELGPNTKAALRKHPRFREALSRLKSGKTQLSGAFSVDMEKYVYHVGNTGVYYDTVCSSSQCTTTFTAFVQTANNQIVGHDGFWDPLVPLGGGDGPGGLYEIQGGTGYVYRPYVFTEAYETY